MLAEMLNLRVHSKVKDAGAELRIGELAAQSGLAATALRYYEQAGLLTAPRRTQAGYRVYDASAVPRLMFIRAAQAVGLSLAEIREILRLRDSGTAPCSHVVELIQRHRAEVLARISELQRLERDLAQLAEQGARLNPADCAPADICRVIPLELAHEAATPDTSGAGVRQPNTSPQPGTRPAASGSFGEAP